MAPVAERYVGGEPLATLLPPPVVVEEVEALVLVMVSVLVVILVLVLVLVVVLV